MRIGNIGALLCSVSIVLGGCSSTPAAAPIAAASTGTAVVSTPGAGSVAAASVSSASSTLATTSDFSTAAAVQSPAMSSSASVGTSTAAPPVTAAAADTQEPGAGTALVVLAQLRIKGRAPMTGYSRAQFGIAWTETTTVFWATTDVTPATTSCGGTSAPPR